MEKVKDTGKKAVRLGKAVREVMKHRRDILDSSKPSSSRTIFDSLEYDSREWADARTTPTPPTPTEENTMTMPFKLTKDH